MYAALLLILIGIGVAVTVIGFKKHKLAGMVGGPLIAVFAILFFWLMSFWGEMLWFESLGYGSRFWTVIAAKAGLAIAGILFGWLVVNLLTFSIPKVKRGTRIGSKIVGAFIGLNWGLANWDTLLRYVNRVSTDIKDPVVGQDTGFYLFSLPFYDALYSLLLLLSIVALISLFISLFVTVREGQIKIERPGDSQISMPRRYRSLYISGAVLIFVLAWGKCLARYHLMYSTLGAVTGPGWTDANIRLPAYGVVAVVTILIGVLLLLAPYRNWFRYAAEKLHLRPEGSLLFTLGSAGVAVIAVWFIALTVLPGMFQWLRVEPNEISLEEPYIAHNIQFTRHGFRLHKIEEREFPVSDVFSQKMVEENPSLFSNIRLWDYRALDAVYKQFQEIRLYYEFEDVDVDRYHIGDVYRQVMVSAREMELSNLPAQSQTFVNRRFKYTHGYGITLTTVNEFTPQGLPNLLVKDIPPKSKHADLEVERPQIYYGELARTHVVANTSEEELDYPRGEENVYINYPGSGGVPITNFWRKFLFGWKFDGTRFLLSTYPTKESRILFHRQVQERVKTLAPFLQFDDDPYIALVDGKLYWIIDAYTTSDYYPYSEPFTSREMIEYRQAERRLPLQKEIKEYLHGSNYVRNSVKAVIDAFDGSVTFYIFDAEDPLIQVWDKVFPGLFKSKQAMPEGLLAHVRYPADMLLVQGLVYAKYHMTDPAVFYNQEDLWIRATEKYYGDVQPVEPYYIMWEPPESDNLEFVLILPFTPKNRQVLIGWIAGMCDPGNYGRLLAYKFPKEKRVLGTQQVETKIDQDRFLSGQLSLWDQRGSKVIRGNVLAIPVGETLLYVEPIYLQAETAAYPELRLVCVMHGDNLSYANSFDEALRGLLEEGAPAMAQPKPEKAAVPGSLEQMVENANDAFNSYLKLLGQKRFEEAAQELQRLQQALQGLSNQAAPAQ